MNPAISSRAPGSKSIVGEVKSPVLKLKPTLPPIAKLLLSAALIESTTKSTEKVSPGATGRQD